MHSRVDHWEILGSTFTQVTGGFDEMMKRSNGPTLVTAVTKVLVPSYIRMDDKLKSTAEHWQ